MRADAAPDDVPLMMCGARHRHAQAARRRCLAALPARSMLDGMRARRATGCRAMAADRRRRSRARVLAWDLSRLLDGAAEDAAGVDALLAEAQRARRRLRRRPRAARSPSSTARRSSPPCASSPTLQDLVGRAGSYAMLRFATDTADPARGALLQRVQERGTAIETELLFFDLEWAALDDERAEALLAPDGPRLLPPPPAHRAALPAAPALRARGEASSPRSRSRGRSAWDAPVRGAGLRDRRPAPTTSEPVALEVALSRLFSPDREVRRYGRRGGHRGARSRACARAATSSTRCWPTRWSTTGCATTRTGWRAATWPTRRPTSRSRRSSRRCAAATSSPRRWYRLKARLLGLDRLADYDRMAAVTDERRADRLGGRARPRARLLRALLARAGRRRARASSTSAGSTRPCARASAAARSAPTRCRRVHPYVLLNYTARRRDVLTLAHELGHGVHAALGAPPGRLPHGARR